MPSPTATPMIPALFLVEAFLLGSVPFSVAAGVLLAGVDPRLGGSGNPGATNLGRLAGRRVAVVGLLGDGLKGAVPVALAPAVHPSPAFAGLVALAAFAGHCWSPFLGFRGGKGVATAAGALLVLAPGPAAAAVGVWVGLVALTRRASLGAAVAALVVPIGCAVWLPEVTLWAVLLGVGVLLRHRDNLARLWAGAERPV